MKSHSVCRSGYHYLQISIPYSTTLSTRASWNFIPSLPHHSPWVGVPPVDNISANRTRPPPWTIWRVYTWVCPWWPSVPWCPRGRCSGNAASVCINIQRTRPSIPQLLADNSKAESTTYQYFFLIMKISEIFFLCWKWYIILSCIEMIYANLLL